MKTVLFIGTHGVYRSKYAEAYFNSIAKNSPYTAISRGTWMRQGRYPRFKRAWNENIQSRHHKPYASKLQYLDLHFADIKIGMYEPENRPQLEYTTSTTVAKKTSGTWSVFDAMEVEYWKVPNLLGTGDCEDGNEVDDPYKIIDIIEYYVDELVSKLIED